MRTVKIYAPVDAPGYTKDMEIVRSAMRRQGFLTEVEHFETDAGCGKRFGATITELDDMARAYLDGE